MRKIAAISALVLLALVCPGVSHAATPAGTIITNRADVTYKAGGIACAVSSAPNLITVLSDAFVSIVKTASVIEPSGGGTRPVPGAEVTYTLTVTSAGTATAAGVVITDPLPANTTYKFDSLTLNGSTLTDGADADSGEVAAGSVTVRLGDMTAATAAQVISFTVIIE